MVQYRCLSAVKMTHNIVITPFGSTPVSVCPASNVRTRSNVRGSSRANVVNSPDATHVLDGSTPALFLLFSGAAVTMTRSIPARANVAITILVLLVELLF
jgi:hypothetical protein